MTTRRARVAALAKINLDLRVLHRRPDHYHELRTIFQTISLADIIDIAFTRGRKTQVALASNIEIADNLVVKAAKLVLDATRTAGRVEFRLQKRIPMGAGLGGGSSDAAAVLLALPVLTGRPIELPALVALAAELGSDVPFFLLGGRAAAIGRGAELFPLPDMRGRFGVVVAGGAHISTAAAYAALAPRLTRESIQNKIVSFQSRVWASGEVRDSDVGSNDFETVVFEQFPHLAALKRRLLKLGAKPAMMTGSGSAVFGVFRTRDEVSRAIRTLRTGDEQVFPITLVSRAGYRARWWRRLEAHLGDKQWPPRSWYAQ